MFLLFYAVEITVLVLRGEAIFEILPDDIFRAVGPAVAIAQYVGFEREKLLQGRKPGRWIAIEFGKERGPDILGEKDLFAIFIHMQGDRTGCVPRGVNPLQNMAVKFKAPGIALEPDINGKGFEVNVKAECGCEPYIASFDYFRILFMHDEPRSETGPHKRRCAHVVCVAMRHDEGPYIIRPKSRLFDIDEHTLEAMS